MDPTIDFSDDLFEQFTLDLSAFSLPADSGAITQNQNAVEKSLSEDTTYNQGIMEISGVGLLATTDLSRHQGVQDSLPVGDVSFISQNMLNAPLPTPDYCTPLIHPHNNELEEFLTPLVSPAITPNFTDMYQFLDSNQEQYFTPLSSPALIPNSEGFGYFNNRHPLSFGSASTNASANMNEISNNMNTANDIVTSPMIAPNDSIVNHKSDSKINNDNDNPADDLITGIQDPVILAQQLAQIEAKQQILRDQMKMSPLMSPTYRKSPLGLYSSGHQNAPPSPLPYNSTKKRTSLRQQIALASPKLQSTQQKIKPQLPTILPSRTPATPASLMKIGHQPPIDPVPPTKMVDAMPSLPPAAIESSVKRRKLAPLSPALSPRTLRPLVSPFLQPNTESLSPSVEIRRSAHKVAEQRRRDTLKQSFDSLRKEIVDVLIEDSGQPAETVKEEKEKEVKLMSKVLLLQHSYEYIARLKTDSQIKDDKLSKMQEELDRLKQMLQDQTQ